MFKSEKSNYIKKQLFSLAITSLICITVHSQEIDSTRCSINKTAIDNTRSYTIDQLNDSTAAIYYAPNWHESITNIPGDFVEAKNILFSKQSLKPLAIIGGSTLLLYAFDKQLVNGVQNLSRNIGLNPASKFNSFIHLGSLNIMQVPGNANTGLYFIGEGWTSILIFGGIGVHGAFTNNKKELRILSQFIEGYIAMGLVTQVFKRSIGRETPAAASSDRGRFQPFPSFQNFQNHMPHYDAMPSGHMATMAFTVTLLAENYPNNKWIRPVGYSLMGACAFSMMNNGVHWASDYPLGFGIGFLFAKIVAKRGRATVNTRDKNIFKKVQISPVIFEEGSSGLSFSLKL